MDKIAELKMLTFGEQLQGVDDMSKYAVIKMNSGTHIFSQWHEDIESARKEAERLCKLERASFGVIELVGVCEIENPVPPVKWRTM